MEKVNSVHFNGLWKDSDGNVLRITVMPGADIMGKSIGSGVGLLGVKAVAKVIVDYVVIVKDAISVEYVWGGSPKLVYPIIPAGGRGALLDYGSDNAGEFRYTLAMWL